MPVHEKYRKMGINYLSTKSGHRLEARVTGGLSVKNAELYFDSLVKDTSVSHDTLEVVRFINGFKLNGGFSDCEAIARSYQKVKYKKHVKATVFVCGSDYAYGIARMFHTAFKINFPEHQVFIARSEIELESLIVGLIPDDGFTPSPIKQHKKKMTAPSKGGKNR